MDRDELIKRLARYGWKPENVGDVLSHSGRHTLYQLNDGICCTEWADDGRDRAWRSDSNSPFPISSEAVLSHFMSCVAQEFCNDQ